MEILIKKQRENEGQKLNIAEKILVFSLVVSLFLGLISGTNLAAASQEEEFIIRLYTVVLERQPEAVELNYWSENLQNGGFTAVDVAEKFFTSPELKEMNLSNEEFVDILNRALFFRKGEPADDISWLNYLENGVSRVGILHRFLLTQEFSDICGRLGLKKGNPVSKELRDVNLNLTSFVNRQYKIFLGRSGDIEGLNFWTGRILIGRVSPEVVSGEFLKSEEFTRKNYNIEEYLKILYRSFMGREGDAEGLAFWLDIISGKNEIEGILVREWLFEKFAYSEEFRNILADMNMEGAELPPASSAITSGFVWPRPGGYRITSRFSDRLHPILGVVRKHDGVDIAGSYGDTIVSAGYGKVITAAAPVSGQNTGGSGYGNYIVIDHGSGVYTLYGHCKNLYVSVGDIVSPSQPIASVGSTGLSTGPHLHFEIQLNGVPQNPLPYFPNLPFHGDV